MYLVNINWLNFLGTFLNWTFGDELRHFNWTSIDINVTDKYGLYAVQRVAFLYCGCEHLSQCDFSSKSFSSSISLWVFGIGLFSVDEKNEPPWYYNIRKSFTFNCFRIPLYFFVCQFACTVRVNGSFLQLKEAFDVTVLIHDILAIIARQNQTIARTLIVSTTSVITLPWTRLIPASGAPLGTQRVSWDTIKHVKVIVTHVL